MLTLSLDCQPTANAAGKILTLTIFSRAVALVGSTGKSVSVSMDFSLRWNPPTKYVCKESLDFGAQTVDFRAKYYFMKIF